MFIVESIELYEGESVNARVYKWSIEWDLNPESQIQYQLLWLAPCQLIYQAVKHILLQVDKQPWSESLIRTTD